MKNIILNLQSIYIKLICLSLAIIVSNKSIIASCEKGNDSTKTNAPFSDVLNSRIYDSDNKEVSFNNGDNYFVILKNNKSCLDCFKELNYFVSHVKDSLNAHFIVISIVDSTALERKRSFYSDRRLMPDFDNYYFQYINQSGNTIFEILNTHHTPEMLLIRRGEIEYIPNSKVFDYPSLDVSVRTQIEIAEFLK